MFAPESVHEHERLGKLFGLDKKSRAINLPLTADLHLLPPLGEVVGEFEFTNYDFRLTIFLVLRCFWLVFISRVSWNVRVELVSVNSISLVQCGKSQSQIFLNHSDGESVE